MHIVLSFVSSGGPHPTIWYRMFAVLAGLCFLHPTPTILHGQTIQIWSIHWRVLVRTSGLGVQNSRGQRWRYADGMHLCSDGNFMGLLPARSQAMVAKYSSDWIQDALSAEAQPICLDCANHQHLGSPAPGSSWPDRNNPLQYACKAAGMLWVWRVWQGWRAGHWQPDLPYQFVGNGLSIRSSVVVRIVYIQIHTTMSQILTTYQYVPHLYVTIRTNTCQQPNTYQYILSSTYQYVHKYVPI